MLTLPLRSAIIRIEQTRGQNMMCPIPSDSGKT